MVLSADRLMMLQDLTRLPNSDLPTNNASAGPRHTPIHRAQALQLPVTYLLCCVLGRAEAAEAET
jgi:hypothetical protein